VSEVDRDPGHPAEREDDQDDKDGFFLADLLPAFESFEFDVF